MSRGQYGTSVGAEACVCAARTVAEAVDRHADAVRSSKPTFSIWYVGFTIWLSGIAIASAIERHK